MPFILRFLQSIVTKAVSKWVGKKIFGCCCAGKDPLNYVGLDADEDDDKGCQQGGGRRGGGAEW